MPQTIQEIETVETYSIEDPSQDPLERRLKVVETMTKANSHMALFCLPAVLYFVLLLVADWLGF